jgi:hypothetical protein
MFKYVKDFFLLLGSKLPKSILKNYRANDFAKFLGQQFVFVYNFQSMMNL